MAGQEVTETILGPALKVGRHVWWVGEPKRHHDIFPIIEKHDYISKEERINAEQGFYTDQGRFLSREEALPIAKASGQFKREEGPGKYSGPELFSEDLW